MVYPVLLVIHNTLRWFVLGSLLATLVSGYSGWLRPRSYSSTDATLRVVATSIAHTQLLVGLYLYTISPIISYYWTNRPRFGELPGRSAGAVDSSQFSFFALIHTGLMVTSVVLMTIGSGMVKRQTDARQRFRTTAIYFTIGLVLILIAVPWPFSSLAARPWVRTF